MDLARLLALRHHDPHSILGIHPRGPRGPRGKAWVLRAWCPDARAAWLVRDAEPDLRMRRLHKDGIFKANLDQNPGCGYQIRAAYAGGVEHLRFDPYAYPPSLGDLDLHLFNEGTHWELWKKMGAHELEHEGARGVSFSVWAPGAEGVSVVGDFNGWDGRQMPMRSLGSSGVWELFVPGLSGDFFYKFEIRPKGGGPPLCKSDPLAQATERPPGTASKLARRKYSFGDQAWMEQRARRDLLRSPLSIYEVHLGSWRRMLEDEERPLSYREAASQLTDYVAEMGFTHVEFLPLMEHPFDPSWGYQVGNYFAPTARYGSPDDLCFLVDTLHQRGIGVLLDWVPAHFPKDTHALGRFTGEAVYEHLDPRQGEHPDWGTFIFNFGRNEVCNFLIASALYWLKEFHFDGLRSDAVASMLYLDYSRKAGEWIPNRYGGRENIEAVDFLKRLNTEVYSQVAGVAMIAEESTAWPAVSRPVYLGGLGFGFKWNMGWMHDTLRYFSKDPVHRRFHHNDLTFGFLYAWTENFILPLSHDEVVHGKGALLDKMPGDRWQKFANVRALYAYMWAHPGKKLLFMGGEFGQWREWRHDQSLDWHLLADPNHAGLQRLVKDLNATYKAHPCLWERDAEPEGFGWIDANNADENVVAFYRQASGEGARIVCLGNFSPVPRLCYRVGLPAGGFWAEIVNTDAEHYGGSNLGNGGSVQAEARPWHGQPYSAELILPPLAVLWLREA